MTEDMTEESIIPYPCDFPIKIFGHNEPDFSASVVEVVLRHAPDFDAASVEWRVSSASNYLSVTCTIRATSRAQLDALYQELVDHPKVKMVL